MHKPVFAFIIGASMAFISHTAHATDCDAGHGIKGSYVVEGGKVTVKVGGRWRPPLKKTVKLGTRRFFAWSSVVKLSSNGVLRSIRGVNSSRVNKFRCG